jgi:4'-phosphopantetheinyl transferase
MALLPSDEVHVWLLRRPQQLDAHLLALTTIDEQKRARNMVSRRRQCEWLAGRMLLRQCLAYYTGCDGLTLAFDKTEAGKPFIDSQDAPAFNLSHGPGWIACAVTQTENLGIDIDSEARRNRTEDIAARYFHTAEQAEIATAGSKEERQRLFFRQWTMKEAYIKALGETINSVRLHEIAFEAEANGESHALFDLPAGRWDFLHWRFDGEHHLALACQRSQCDTGDADKLRCRFWLWDATTQSRRELTDEWPCIT